jgi:hypothetical protein
MKTVYPANNAICETTEQWRGRNLVRAAFQKSAGQSREYKRVGNEVAHVVREDRPLYWTLASPEVAGRAHFPIELAMYDAACARSFLEANNVKVTDQFESTSSYIAQTLWPKSDRDLVRVYGNGSYCDPHANDPATVAMVPGMRRKIWNLVRFDYDEYEF